MSYGIAEQNRQTLERGSIYFFYRRFFEEDCECANDVQRYFMVLNPAWSKIYRVMMLGKKKAKKRRPESPNTWGIVRKTAVTPEQIEIAIDAKCYHTKTRKERQLKAPRPVGHGLYSILASPDDTHLVYSLEGMPQPCEFVPKDFAIAPEADYVLKVKSPARPFPPGMGIEDEAVEYPPQIQMLFENSHWAKADPTEILNYEGTGVLMTAAEETETESGNEDDVQLSQYFIDELRRAKTRCHLEPLLAGARI
jgi:hypothetical protein